jgi:glycosyltransferase involved in cell wall biosynthesis
MRILLINQYAPPDQSPTARLLGELAESLKQSGHSVHLLADRAIYRGHHQRKGSRLARELKALVGITGHAAVATRPDLIIAFSSPPCLLAGVAGVGAFRRIPVMHWAMDLYPDLAIALGELRAPLAISFFRRLMRWAYRRSQLIVALDEDMAAHLARTYGVRAEVLPPWPPPTAPTDAAKARVSAGSQIASAKWTWLYSGNLGRAHEWKILIDAQRELERRDLPIQLLFEGGGAQWEEARKYAEEQKLRSCVWTGYVTEEESAITFAASRLIVVTQRVEAQGLLWPSKLARILVTDKPLLWIGPSKGAIAESLRDRPLTACFERNDATLVADWVQQLPDTPSRVSGSEPSQLEKVQQIRNESCARFADWIARLC